MASVKKRSTLKVWGDVIFAIFLREIKSNFSDKFGLSWALVSPMLMVVVMVAIRGALDSGETHGMPTIYFIVYGVVLIQFFLGVLEKVSRSIQKNKPLYAFRQVQPISSIIAIAGFELLVKIFLVIVLMTIAFFAHFDLYMNDPIEVIFIVLRVWLIAMSVGMILSLAGCYVPEVNKLQVFITRPVFFISGIFFSLQDIPREYWHYLDWNPILHAVELIRYSGYPNYGDIGVSFFYLDMVTLISVFFALACYHIAWKQAISR
ncbi:ABC transporter permease [Psychromonas sp. SP041]|uniref:ABC transporter permease n=1 Tax=Psychromonas sp. SP041 TaxID=1365007 RepID=UPI000417173E|nr:ABC transporter permease [Psychromonas sp. SP041]